MDNEIKTLPNRAEVSKTEQIYCDKCFEQVIFVLKAQEHEFLLGLTTVLECLAFAIQNGDLPKLPRSWCTDVQGAYEAFGDVEGMSYYDYERYKVRQKNEVLQNDSDTVSTEI